MSRSSSNKLYCLKMLVLNHDFKWTIIGPKPLINLKSVKLYGKNTTPLSCMNYSEPNLSELARCEQAVKFCMPQHKKC